MNSFPDKINMRKVISAISPLLDNIKTKCPDQSCRDMCLYGNTTVYVCIFCCKCDHLCPFYGDCCLDYFIYCNNSNSAPSPNNEVSQTQKSLTAIVDFYKDDNILKLPKMTCQDIPGPFYSMFYVIDKCLDTHKASKAVKDSCESPKNRSIDEVILVYNPEHGIFRNKYCAECQNLNLGKVCPFLMNIKCTNKGILDELEQLAFEDQSRFIAAVLEHCSLTFTIGNNDANVNKLFNTLYGDFTPACTVPFDIQRFACYDHHLKTVQNIYSSDSETAMENVARKLCGFFVLPLAKIDRSSFLASLYDIVSNPLCPVSAGTKNLECLSQSEALPVIPGHRNATLSTQFPSFILLFDFSSKLSVQVYRKKQQLHRTSSYDRVCNVTECLDILTSRCAVCYENANLKTSDKDIYNDIYETLNKTMRWSLFFMFDNLSKQEIEVITQDQFDLNFTTHTDQMVLLKAVRKLKNTLDNLKVSNPRLSLCKDLASPSGNVSDAFDRESRNYPCLLFLLIAHNDTDTKIFNQLIRTLAMSVETFYRDVPNLHQLVLYNTGLQNWIHDKFIKVKIDNLFVRHGEVFAYTMGEFWPASDIVMVTQFWKDRQSNESHVEMYMLVEKTDPGMVQGVVTLVCNTLSMISLLWTITIYSIRKSLRTKTTINILNLSIAILFAQVFFQVRFFPYLYIFLCVRKYQITVSYFLCMVAFHRRHQFGYEHMIFITILILSDHSIKNGTYF